jgi:ADP-heptose:LPS heptosyltransferase
LAVDDFRIFPFRPSQSDIHMEDYYLSCLGKTAPVESFPRISLRANAVSWVRRFWQQNGLRGDKILAIAPGSGATGKNWPVDAFMTVSCWWKARTKGKTLIVSGPAEEERMGNERFWEDALPVRGLNLSQLAALLARCDIFLGNDSGVTHLAAALGVKTIAIFGPTNPVQWGPRGRNVSVIAQDVPCSPCEPSVMKSCPHRRCLTGLCPSVVIGNLEESLFCPRASLTRRRYGTKVETIRNSVS